MTETAKEYEGFDDAYQKYSKLVHRLSLKYSGYDDMLAEDATQHAFMQLYIEMEKGTKIANIKTYLHTIVKNYTINQGKKMGREVLGDELEDYSQNRVEESEQSAEMTYLDMEEHQISGLMLEAILSELKEKNPVWYTVAIEVFYKERSQLEVAKELGMSETSMYATVRRIRAWSNKHRIRFNEDADNKTQKGASEAPFLSL